MKITNGLVLRINEEPFVVAEEASLRWQDGDDEESLTLHVLRRQRDGLTFFLSNERDEPALFSADVRFHHPDWSGVSPPRSMTLQSEAIASLPSGDVRVTALETRQGVAPGLPDSPLGGVYEGLRITQIGAPAEDQGLTLLGRRLVWRGEGVLLTDDTPAADLPRQETSRRKVAARAFRTLGALLALLLASLVVLDPLAWAHDTLDYMTLVWVLGLGSTLGLIFLRSSGLRPFFHLVAAAFFLHLETQLLLHLLVTWQVPPTWNLAGFHFAGLLAALVLLDAAAPRAYAMVSHAALLGGVAQLVLYSVGFAIWALHSGEWYHFREHLGALPQGALALLLLIALLVLRIRDYARVPVTLDGTLGLIKAIDLALSGDLAAVHARAKTLAALIDDLGDAFVVSNDPRVTSAHGLSPRFFRLSSLFKQLGGLGLDRIREPALLSADLETLRGDLAALHETLRRGVLTETLPEPRFPPCLETVTRSPKWMTGASAAR